MTVAAWLAVLCPLMLFVVLVPLTILVYRERRRRWQEEQLDVRARRERGD